MTLRDEPVLFGHTVEALHSAFGDRLNNAARQSLLQIGMDMNAPLPAYPLYVGEEAIKVMARALYPELPEKQGWERMGEEWLEGYLQTMLGKAILAMGRTIGLRRVLERMQRNFKTASNYLSAAAVVHGPTDVELRTWIEPPYLDFCSGRESVLLHYRVGILRQAVHEFRARNPDVSIEAWEPATQTARYRIRWEA